MGPISLFLQQLHYYTFAIDATTMQLDHYSRDPFPFLTCPYQLLKPTIFKLAILARNKHATTQRTILKHATQIDDSVYHKALNKLEDPAHIKIVRYLSTLGAVHQGSCHKYNNDNEQDKLCPFCNDAPSSH
eukprot:7871083-Karenia_brevis.AAC.1